MLRVLVRTEARFPFPEARVLCETLLGRVRGGKLGAEIEIVRGGGRRGGRGRTQGELWLLDERGEAWSSERWARELGAAADRAAGQVVLRVGGAFGATDDVSSAASRRLSLGPCTLPSWLACVVLCEQVYRADTILRGAPYHHG